MHTRPQRKSLGTGTRQSRPGPEAQAWRRTSSVVPSGCARRQTVSSATGAELLPPGGPRSFVGGSITALQAGGRARAGEDRVSPLLRAECRAAGRTAWWRRGCGGLRAWARRAPAAPAQPGPAACRASGTRGRCEGASLRAGMEEERQRSSLGQQVLSPGRPRRDAARPRHARGPSGASAAAAAARAGDGGWGAVADATHSPKPCRHRTRLRMPRPRAPRRALCPRAHSARGKPGQARPERALWPSVSSPVGAGRRPGASHAGHGGRHAG